MPTVPRYSRDEIQIRAQPKVLNTARIDPEDLAAPALQAVQLGRAIGQLGETWNRIELVRSAAAVGRAEAEARDAYDRSAPRQSDFPGIKAGAYVDAVAKAWDSASSKQLDSIEDDTQRAMLEHSLGQMRARDLDAAQAWADREQSQAGYDGLIASADNEAAYAAGQAPQWRPTQAGEPESPYDQARERGVQRVIAARGMHGDAPPAIDKAVRDYLTDLHLRSLEALHADPDRARQYLDAYAEEIDPRVLPSIQRKLAAATRLRDTQATVDDLRRQGLSEEQGLEYIRQNFQGEDEKSRVIEWRQRHAEDRAIKNQQQRGHARNAWQAYRQHARLSAIPAADLVGMSPAARASLEQRALIDLEDRNVHTDPATYNHLRRRILAGEDAPLENHLHQVSDPDLARLEQLQQLTPDQAEDQRLLQTQIDQATASVPPGPAKEFMEDYLWRVVQSQESGEDRRGSYSERGAVIKMVLAARGYPAQPAETHQADAEVFNPAEAIKNAIGLPGDADDDRFQYPLRHASEGVRAAPIDDIQPSGEVPAPHEEPDFDAPIRPSDIDYVRDLVKERNEMKAKQNISEEDAAFFRDKTRTLQSLLIAAGLLPDRAKSMNGVWGRATIDGAEHLIAAGEAFQGQLGDMTAFGESGRKGVSAISTGKLASGKSDRGGISYGILQLTSANMKAFLESEEGRLYKDLYFAGVEPGTDKFKEIYDSVAQEAGDVFSGAQRAYLMRVNYKPTLEEATKLGFDVDDRGVQEALFSLGNQHGKRKVVLKLAKKIGHGKIPLSAEEQITLLYKARSTYYPADSAERYPRESKIARLISKFDRQSRP